MLVSSTKKSDSGVVKMGNRRTDKVSLIAGVDAGSTMTRVSLADKEDFKLFCNEDEMLLSFASLENYFDIPSTFASVPDEREIVPTSRKLKANYDSHIIRVSTAAENPIFKSERLIRGQKIDNTIGIVARYLDSSTNKTDNAIFYLNVIDALGYAIMNKYNYAVPTEVDLFMVISVRPKELTRICHKRMKDNFIGKFIFQWGGDDITLNIKDLSFTTEPEAQISGTSMLYSLRAALCNNDHAKEYEALANKLSSTKTHMHIEGGGSSIGIEVVRGGELISACSSTFQLGGNYLTRITSDSIREELSRTASDQSIAEAILTGRLRDGSETIDVSENVSKCEEQLSLNIVEKIRHVVLDVGDISMRDVEFISLGGRLFNTNEQGESVAFYIESQIHQLSPNTAVIVLPENYIPQGNLIIGINDNPFWSAEDEDEEAEAAGAAYAECEVEELDDEAEELEGEAKELEDEEVSTKLLKSFSKFALCAEDMLD